MLTRVGVMGLTEAPPVAPIPQPCRPGVWMTEGVRMGGKLEFSEFSRHRLTFLELKEALRNALPTPEVTGEGKAQPRGHQYMEQGASALILPLSSLQPQGFHSISCQPQGPLHTVPPSPLPSSPQPSSFPPSSTPGPLCILFFLHTTVQPFTITPTLLAPQNGIHPWGSQLTLHHRALSSASDSGCLFSVV